MLRTIGRPNKGRLVGGAIGENPATEMPWVPLDPVTRFGADAQYRANARAPYTAYPFTKSGLPWILHASNKISEHNIFNSWPVIIVAQLAGQTEPPGMRRIVSRRIRMPQVLGGGA